MAQTVHKVLIHGHDIVQRQTLHIGLIPQGGQKARSKDFKNYRKNFC